MKFFCSLVESVIEETFEQYLMKSIHLFLLLFLFSGNVFAFQNLDVEQLQKAILEENCATVSTQIDTSEGVSDTYRFYRAICLSKTGNQVAALEDLNKVDLAKVARPNNVRYWHAKVNALLKNEEAAINHLKQLPVYWLNYRLLDQAEFEQMRASNAEFQAFVKQYKPAFNIWTTVLSIVTLLGWILGFLLLFKRSKFAIGERWLALIMLTFSLILTSYILIWTKYNIYFTYINSWWMFLTFIIGPTLFFYLKSVFQESYTTKEVLFHFLPTFLVAFSILPYLLSPFKIYLQWPEEIATLGSSAYLKVIHLIVYGMWCQQLCNNDWQIDENIKIWAKLVTRGFWVYVVGFCAYFILVNASFFSPEWDYSISLIMALGILLIAWMGWIQPKVFQSEPIEQFIPIPVSKYQSSTLTEAASASIKRRLEQLLIEEEIYKENELRLDDLAAYIDVSRHHLSQVINETYQINFFEFINQYRVTAVKKMLQNPKYDHYTLLQIAFESGFNNKASFNKFFKQDTGMTPSAYRLMVREKEKETTKHKR